MDEQRFVVSERLWQRLQPHLPGKASDSGVTAKDDRQFLEAVFSCVSTRLPWRDLPPAFENWNSQLRRFRRWPSAVVFENLFDALSNDPNLEYVLIDGTIVQVHEKATGAKEGLRLTRSGARVAGGRPRSWRCWTRLEAWFCSCCCQGRHTT